LDYKFERLLFAHGTPILTKAMARLQELLRFWRLEERVNSEDPNAEARRVLGGASFVFLRLIRFSHTVFALPFALGALFVRPVAAFVENSPARADMHGPGAHGGHALQSISRLSLDQRNPALPLDHLLLAKPNWL